MISDKRTVICPKCGAIDGEPCKTPKGRKKEKIHHQRYKRQSFDGKATSFNEWGKK